MKFTLLLVLIHIFLFSTLVAAEFLDDAPYWFWAEKWEGELSVDFKDLDVENGPDNFQHHIESRGRIEVKNAIFKNKALKYDLLSYKSSGSNAQVTWWEKADVVGAGKKGYFAAFTVDNGQEKTSIDADSLIMLDIEKGIYQIDLILPLDFEITLKRKYHFQGEGIDGGRYWNIVEDENFQETEYPNLMGTVKKEFPEPGNGFAESIDMNDGSYQQYTFYYQLAPIYDQSKWREDYLLILRSQRQSYLKMWNDILENCGCEDGNCIICRSANKTLESLEEWLNYLADDGVRVCDLLSQGKAPGLLPLIKRDYSQYIVRHVKKGPAYTANIIHKFLYHFYDSQATGSIDAIYNRLPTELKQLYSKEKLVKLNNAY